MIMGKILPGLKELLEKNKHDLYEQMWKDIKEGNARKYIHSVQPMGSYSGQVYYLDFKNEKSNQLEFDFGE